MKGCDTSDMTSHMPEAEDQGISPFFPKKCFNEFVRSGDSVILLSVPIMCEHLTRHCGFHHMKCNEEINYVSPLAFFII